METSYFDRRKNQNRKLSEMMDDVTLYMIPMGCSACDESN